MKFNTSHVLCFVIKTHSVHIFSIMAYNCYQCGSNFTIESMQYVYSGDDLQQKSNGICTSCAVDQIDLRVPYLG